MSGCLALMTGSRTAVRVVAPDINSQVAEGFTASGSSTAVASGGYGSYSYAWTASLAGVSFTGTNTATLTATRTSTAAGVSTTTASVLVTDLLTGATAVDSISVYLENL